MTVFTDIAVRSTVEDFVKARNESLKLYEDGRRLIEQAEEKSKAWVRYAFPSEGLPRSRREEVVKEIDRSYWREAFRYTGLARLLDAQATQEFENSLRDNPPTFSVENVQNMALELFQKRDELRLRGVYNLFRRISDHYRTNEKHAFEVKRKIILEFVFDQWWTAQGTFTLCHRQRAMFNDLDRSICQLMDLPYQEYSLESEVQRQFKEQGFFENDLLKLKGFKNGNGHLWIKDETLLKRINQSIAEYVGPAIPAEKQRREA